MKTYILTILKSGNLYDEVIFNATSESKALEYACEKRFEYDNEYVLHVAEYYGNGKKGKMISVLKR